MNRPPHPKLSPRSGGEGVVEVAGFLMMAKPQTGPVFSPLPQWGQGEGEVSFSEQKMRYPSYEPLYLGCLLPAAWPGCRQGGWRATPTLLPRLTPGLWLHRS